AFIITPWASYILLRDQFTKREAEKDHKTGAYWRFYSSIMAPMLASNVKRYAFYFLNVLLLMLSIGLLISKAVVVKMLPYDNKSEVQVVLDMPEGTSLERTLEVAKDIANIISKQSLVSNYQIYVGTSSPFNFNGLVRHYYLRNSSNLADIQINLIHKDKREEQSHDFAKKLRPLVREVAFKSGAKYVAVVEVPPGPPVLSPVVAEVYAPELKTQESVAREVLKIFKNSKSVTDEGIYLEDQTDLISVIINQEKLLKAGLNKEEVVITLQSLFGGKQIGIIQNTDTEHTPIVIKMDEKLKSIEALNSLKLISQSGNLVPLSEVVELRKEPVPSTIYHKNLRRVNYVIGDVAGREEAPFYAVLDVRDEIKNLQTPFGKIKELWLSQPVVEDGIYIKWDGEMHITLEVFRDLGLAFAIALFVMYVLILGWFKDFKVPGIIMAPIPLTLVGIVPGHLIMGAFFTATSMIGFIALAGIIVRNSILLVDFAQHRIQQGVAPHVAVVESGVIRTRPIVLTAVAIIVGAFVLVFDPIFNGLAISIIFGTIGSTILTLFLIPLMYYASKTKGNNRPSKEQITKDLSG
ncbi:MAG: efflux RND transporter permease subunit, partial [Aquificaceae bacterium]